jgi:hypothetical protein
VRVVENRQLEHELGAEEPPAFEFTQMVGRLGHTQLADDVVKLQSHVVPGSAHRFVMAARNEVAEIL